MNTPPKIFPIEETNPQALAEFWRSVYPAQKSEFLIQHSAWQHASNCQYVIETSGKIVGYSALIPTRVNMSGEVRRAHWWVDLIIAPEARGQGLQSLMDKFIRAQFDLLLGFPNAQAAEIHRKHQWGVRDDMKALLLPLRPTRMKSVQRSHNAAIRLGAYALTPLAALWRGVLSKRDIQSAQKIPLDENLLAEISTRWQNAQPINSAQRDAAFFSWRYGQSPHADEYTCFAANNREGYLILRNLINADGLRHSRILDVFGNFQNPAMLADLLSLAAQDALRRGSAQITLLASLPELAQAARRQGFIFSAPVRFCWLGDAAAMSAFSQKNYWTLADSDNDEVE